MEFTRPSPNSIFNIYNRYSIKLLTILCLGLSHFRKHKFKHGFNNTINPICICGGDIESINHLFNHCPKNFEARQALFNNVQDFDKTVLNQNESLLTCSMDSSSTWQRNSYYLQEDSLKLSNSFFIWLSKTFF